MGNQQSCSSWGAQHSLGTSCLTPLSCLAQSHCHQALMGFSECHSCADAEALAWQPRCTLALPHPIFHLAPKIFSHPPDRQHLCDCWELLPWTNFSASLSLPAQEMPLLVTAPRLPKHQPAHPFPSNVLLQQQLLCQPNCTKISRMP